MHAFLIVDKPQGISSHAVVSRLRKLLNIKRVGHTGTLDPMATGVLPVAIGEATRAIPFLREDVKVYQATIGLGAATDTQDAEGDIIFEGSTDILTEDCVRESIASMCGVIEQLPPMYSAIKKNGVPLYKLARMGKDVERKRRTVTIHSWTLDRYSQTELVCTIECSRGTYVRTLAHDLGEKLGCGAHLTGLRRLRSGPFTIDRAHQLDELDEKLTARSDGVAISILQALSHRTVLAVRENAIESLLNGVPPSREDISGDLPGPGAEVSLTYRNCLVAAAVFDPEHMLDDRGDFKLNRVFNLVREVMQ